eukprot:6422424-Pyramimonas_sp.AAC.1
MSDASDKACTPRGGGRSRRGGLGSQTERQTELMRRKRPQWRGPNASPAEDGEDGEDGDDVED